MASPPFQLEDQTDADFFDKLVDDEFRVSESNPSFVDGVDSDEVKAFSNLNIVEVGNISEDSGGEGGFAPEEEKHSTDVIVPSSDAPEKDILVSEESISLVSSNSVVLDNRVEFSDGATGVDVSSESSTSKSSGSKSTSIKEVQWSSFYADSAQNGGNGFGSYSDFFREEGDPFANVVDSNLKVDSNQDEQAYVASIEQIPVDQNLDNSQYWENLYPGWRYDPNTGEWHEVEDHNAAANAPQVTSGGDLVSGQTMEVSYLQQAAQSVVGTVAEGCTTGNVSTWNQASQESTEYPSHMVFDPQYPGWYYDTIAQEWCALESYTPAVQSTSTAHDQKIQDRNDSNTGFFPITEENNIYGDGSQRLGGQNQGGGGDWAGSGSNNVQQNLNMWQLQTAAKTDSLAGFTENRQSENLYGSRDLINNLPDQQMGFKSMGTSSLYEQTSHNYGGNDIGTGFQSFVPANNFSPQISLPKVEQSQSMPFSHDYYGSQKSTNYSHQPFQTGTQLSFNPNEGRSSAGRPPHALVTFGFGGKLVVMKDNSSFVTKSAYGSQDAVGGSISVLDLMDVVIDKNSPIVGVGVSDYFRTLCQQSFPGPLVGGSVGSKELNKWIDERITNCESPNMDYRKGTLLRLLLSLLKIACQHYGKLRSPFGTDPSLKESDRPESAVAKLFGSAKRNGVQPSGYGALIHCLQNVPSEGQLLATAAEVQNLLVSGRTKEALQYAQEGQLWGPALILAAQLGDQYYVDTVKQMAHRQLVAGSPLRTLCLLIAGQPADVFSADSTTSSALPGAVNMSQPYPQIGPNGMLDDWEENLAIITSNRTKGDELVILHLGDCLWKERGEITAAHICYLVAEANFESFSDGARLCLIGADHWKFPRTYASPEAIQRTELYEYSMVLGNSQSILLPFQPYKLIYAHMLAEVGKVSDSLKYCQAVLKSLKTGRAPEVDVWKQLVLSLEERIRTNQQGGFSTNLAAGKLVGKLLPFIDRSIHRMMGPLPPPAPSVQTNEHDSHVGPRVANSQSTMAVSSLMPSASMEPISEWMGESSRMSVPNRSISEPDFGRSPRQGQVDQSKGASSDKQGKSSVSGGPSRFGRFGSQILQKTMGWVSRSPSERQAKLGEKNKFYYDENLKRWVEEGAEPPAEETALPPPPPTAAFQNGMSGYNTKTTFQSESSPSNGGPEIKSPTPLERTPGIPPIPPSSNQFSARGRMGVRSRYVDTFNKGSGTPTNLFQSPSLPSAKPVGGANAKFFIPTPATSGEQTVDTAVESMQEAALASTNEDRSTSMSMDSFSSPLAPSSTSSMQRFPSMNSITPTGNKGMGMQGNSNGSLSSHSRRTASWSGSINDAFNPPKINEVKPLGEALGMPPSSFMPSDSSSMRLPMNGSGSFGDDLHEVEL